MSSVDVIVPCYCYGQFLRECVCSVLNQSIKDVRLLIIDDASPDGTAEVACDLARQDYRVTFLRHAANKGHIYTYNEGIEWAAADYMLILSADDYLLPGALQRAIKLMDEHPEVGFSFGNVIQLSEDGRTIQVHALKDVPENAPWRILTGVEFVEISGAINIVGTPTAVVRTNLQKRVSGYRPELPHSGDMEMWLRLAAHASVGFVKAYQAVYRRHSSNMSKAFMSRNWLPDVQQRKLALDCYFRERGSTLPNSRTLHRNIYRSLACEAVGFASSAFNEGDADTSEQLSQLALKVSSEVKTSWPWIKLACKRVMGLPAWNVLQTIIAGCRRAHRA